MSATGGAQPRWRRDGRELFYLAPDGHLMAVPITWRSNGRPEIGQPASLFQAPVPGRLDTYRNYYFVTPDGDRFLMEFVGDRSGAVVLLQNWISALQP